MIFLSILYALLGISVLIFVHELGHFLAAKRVGVRVERFAIGFDPPVRGRNLRLLSVRRGETEYVLGVIPFGGYVKLAGGEMMLEPGRQARPDELPGKSIGARSLVFAAGSAMNVLFAFIFFMLAFTIGVPFPEPQFGLVEPGTPAWEAGIKPGDRVLEIDGQEPVDFNEVRLAVALGSPTKTLQLKVARTDDRGESSTFETGVTPRWNPELGFNVIGVGPTLSSLVGDLESGGLAARAGIRKGDRVIGLELSGTRMPELPFSLLMNALLEHTQVHPNEAFKVLVARDGGEQWIEVAPAKKEGKPLPQIGVLYGQGNVVRAIHASSDAGKFLNPRDQVTGINGVPVQSVHWLNLLDVGQARGENVSLTVFAADGQERTVSVDRLSFLAWNLKDEIQWAEHLAVVGVLARDSPLSRAGWRQGDIVTHIDETLVYSPGEIAEIQSRDGRATVAVRMLREGRSTVLEMPRSDLHAMEGLAWQAMPRVAAVIRGGPAEAAGVVAGSKIVRIGDRRVHAWKDMVETLRGSRVGAKVEIAWLDPRGEEHTAPVTLSLQPLESLNLSLDFLQRMVRVSALESFRTGAKRTVLAAKQLFLTLRSLIRREVSPKNLSGPVGITHLLTKVAEQNSASTLIYYLALISINLGLFNLLPFPILDGGHLLFLGIEKIKGSPVSVKVQEWATNVAFLIIVFLALFVTFNDLKRLLE